MTLRVLGSFALTYSRLVFGSSCVVVTLDLTMVTRQLAGCLHGPRHLVMGDECAAMIF